MTAEEQLIDMIRQSIARATVPQTNVIRIRSHKAIGEYATKKYPWLTHQIGAMAIAKLAIDLVFEPRETRSPEPDGSA